MTGEPPSAPTRGPKPTSMPAAAAIAAVAALALAAAALRIGAAGGDLWLDEIWSLDNVAIAREARDRGTWLALFMFGNSHPVNTLYMAILGPDASALAYRALALATGIATVAAAAALGLRRGRAEAAFAAILVGLSYAMVNFAGEARGYAPMMLAAVVAVHVFEDWLERGGRGRLHAFVVLTLVAFFGHATFVAGLGGLALWAAAVLRRRGFAWPSVLTRLAAAFGLQAAVAAFYVGALLQQSIGRDELRTPASESLPVMAAMAFGVDPAWPGAGVLVAAVAAGLVATVVGLYRRGESAWLPFGLVAVAAPVVLAALDPPVSTAPRYFAVNALFALLLAARGLAALWSGERHARMAAVLLVALFCMGNGLLLEKFFALGRGHYADAVRFIADAGPAPARVAGYQAHRIGTVLGYHAQRLGLADSVRFVDGEAEATAPADWYVDGGRDAVRPAPEITRTVGGSAVAYRLARVFPHWGLSGETWVLYHRAG